MNQDEPKTYQKVASSLATKKWLEAMRFEMDSMSVNQSIDFSWTTWKGQTDRVQMGFQEEKST